MGEAVRLDKWLWMARFFKSRSLAASVIKNGAVRVNGTRITKPAHLLHLGDHLGFSQGNQLRLVVIKAFGTRRGPASEAQTLYEDHTPPPIPKTANDMHHSFDPAAKIGRPDKRTRRQLQSLQQMGSPLHDTHK